MKLSLLLSSICLAFLVDCRPHPLPSIQIVGNGIEQFFDQKVDHFNSYGATTTFKQKWYYNDSFYGGCGNPWFFQAGGEGPVSGIGYPFFIEFAVEQSGLLLTMEHRFYGSSMPFGNSDSYIHSSDRLGLLQVEQALADYAELIIYLKNNVYNCTTSPVVVFGGSYPGELSVWLRMKYPHVFDMALGSSAPIYYTDSTLVDPYAYYSIITQAADNLESNCSTVVRIGYEALNTATPQQITSGIPLCNELSPNKEEGLYELEAFLYETFANYGMGNYPPANSGFKHACLRMLNGNTNNGLDIMSRFLDPYKNLQGCVNLQDKKPAGPNATIHCSDLTGCGTGLAGESWDYQACSQNIEPFATNNVTDMFYPWDWSMQWLDNHCKSRFGILSTPRQHWMRKEFSLDNFINYNASHIIFSNGLQDGWSAGGIKTTLSDTLIAIVMENGAHHSDMHAPNVNDTQDVINARNEERRILNEWIHEAKLQKLNL